MTEGHCRQAVCDCAKDMTNSLRPTGCENWQSAMTPSPMPQIQPSEDAKPKLLPCPFCGNNPKVTEYYGHYDKADYCVWCETCDQSLDGDSTPEAAASRWNKHMTEAAVTALRQPPQPTGDVGELVERLRKPVMLHSNPEQTNAERREAAAMIEALVSRLSAQTQEAEAVCDSYADENQRLFDRAEAAEQSLRAVMQRLSNIEGMLDHNHDDKAFRSHVAVECRAMRAALTGAGEEGK